MKKKFHVTSIDSENILRFVGIFNEDEIIFEKDVERSSKPPAKSPEGEEIGESPSQKNGVKLDPKAPDFKERRAALKKLGYCFIGKHQKWYPPKDGKISLTKKMDSSKSNNWWNGPEEVTLSKDDVNFKEKYSALKEAGYRWDRVKKLWVQPGGADG